LVVVQQAALGLPNTKEAQVVLALMLQQEQKT